MGLKNTIKSFFSKKEESTEPSNELDLAILSIIEEGYYVNQWGTEVFEGTIAKTKSYQNIKLWELEKRKSLTFHLVNKLEEIDKGYRINPHNTKKGKELFKKRYIYSEVLNLMMRSNLEFSEGEIMELLNLYKSADKSKSRAFKDWPIGFTVQQAEKKAKKGKLSDEFIADLKKTLTWPQFDQKKYHWGADLEKVKLKLEKIIFEHENDSGVPPYKLPEDRLSQIVNLQIEQRDDKEIWYSLFHLFIKATGSKPTKKHLQITSKLIDDIGNAKYKKIAHEWLENIISFKEIETEHTVDYGDGSNYTYSSYEFLHEKNLIFTKGLIWSLSKFHDSKTLNLVAKLTERSFKKIPGVGPTAAGLGNACLYVLGNTKGLEGISHLSRLKLKIKQNNTKKIIENYIETSSVKLGVSTSEIEELSIPDFGLIDGVKEYKFDDFVLKAEIESLGKLSLKWIKPDGNIQKTTPSFVKDSSKLKLQLKKSKDEIAQIKKYLTAQRDRIDRMYLDNRIWTYENFCKFYTNHGLVSFIAKDLIWEFENKGDFFSALFIDNSWVAIDGNELNWIDEETQVRLWHPINATTNDVLTWRNKLENLQIKQCLKQAYREVYILTDAEVNTKTYSNRMAAHLLKQHQFNALTGIRRWKYSLMGAYDDGRDGDIASINIKSHQLEAQFWINEVNADESWNDAGIWDYVATDQVRFIDNEGEVVDLVNIPKIVLSEVMRDVDLFVGVTSVGNDPEWRDNGGLPQYRDYWTSYSFGELTEVAKTRKVILEKLVPRLKIAKVASLEGKFLKVKGTKRVYKIHMGSTNILMEPNDQYLCIVPARGKDKKTENIFLPFEGDRGLSLILSKAFLLAEDDKITDQTILSQINRK